jgi:hypothetical protein
MQKAADAAQGRHDHTSSQEMPIIKVTQISSDRAVPRPSWTAGACSDEGLDDSSQYLEVPRGYTAYSTIMGTCRQFFTCASRHVVVRGAEQRMS